MSFNKRIVYADVFENGTKQGSAGFVRVVEREHTNLEIHMTQYPAEGVRKEAVFLQVGERELTLGSIEIRNGKGMLRVDDLETRMEEEGIIRAEGQGACLKIDVEPGKEICCVIEQKAVVAECTRMDVPEERQESDPRQEGREKIETQKEEAEKKKEVETAELPTAEPNMAEKIASVQRDKWKQLSEVFSFIHPFRDERQYLRLDLCDLIILPRKYYRLVENSFLLHGYHNYEHLILTRNCKNGMEKYYIGVPGNYYEKEKQVAVLFGFESFEPKREPAGEGDFGYYMISVEI